MGIFQFVPAYCDAYLERFWFEWSVVQDKGSIGYISTQWHFLFLDELNCVGCSDICSISLRQSAPFITETLKPDVAIWSFEDGINCFLFSIWSKNMCHLELEEMLSCLLIAWLLALSVASMPNAGVRLDGFVHALGFSFGSEGIVVIGWLLEPHCFWVTASV